MRPRRRWHVWRSKNRGGGWWATTGWPADTRTFSTHAEALAYALTDGHPEEPPC